MMVHPEEDKSTKRSEWDSEDKDGYEEIDVDIEEELYG